MNIVTRIVLLKYTSVGLISFEFLMPSSKEVLILLTKQNKKLWNFDLVRTENDSTLVPF